MVATLVSDYSDSVALVKAESAELARADSALRLLDSKRAELARDKLHDYVKSVVNEWPRLRKGVPDVETGAKIRQLNLLLLDLGQAESESTPIVNEVRERVAQLGEFRARRFLSAESEGITYFWLLGFVGFAALLIQFGCFGRTRPGNFLIAVFCIMQATVFYVALVASNPFARPGAISPAMSRP